MKDYGIWALWKGLSGIPDGWLKKRKTTKIMRRKERRTNNRKPYDESYR